MKYKVRSFLAVFCLLCFCFCLFPVASASAAAEPRFALSEAAGAAGDTVAVTVQLQTAQSNVGGLRLSVAYDSQKLEYVNGSRIIGAQGIQSTDLNPDKAANGRIYFSWCAQEGITLNGNIVTFQFKIHSGTKPGNAALVLTVHEMFAANAQMTDLISSSLTVNGKIAVTGVGAAAQNVMDKINEIGTVVLSDTVKQKIDQAMAAYTALPYIERAQVSNYNVLLTAQDTYKRLYDQSIAAANAAAAEVYRTKHNTVLSKTVKTLSLQDKTAVTTALEEWKSISSVAVQGLLINEKILLNQFVTRLDELQRIENNRLTEERLKREAEEIAAQFRADYKQLLSQTIETVNAEYQMAIDAALGDLESYGFVNSLVPDLLQKEKNKLLSFQEKINKGTPKTPAYETEALNFKRNFGYIIHMDPGVLSMDEYYDVKVALGCYEMLSSDAQSLLQTEYTLLSALNEVLENMPQNPEPDDPDDPSGITDPEPDANDPEKKQPGQSASVIYNRYRKMHPAVWWLIADFAVCMLALAGSFALYFNIKHKYSLVPKKGVKSNDVYSSSNA